VGAPDAPGGGAHGRAADTHVAPPAQKDDALAPGYAYDGPRGAAHGQEDAVAAEEGDVLAVSDAAVALGDALATGDRLATGESVAEADT